MKPVLFLDTNVMLDFIGNREPFYDDMEKILSLADMNKVALVVSALSYATVYYLQSKYEDQKSLREKLRKFKVIAQTADLTSTVVDKGLVSDFTDFEDSLQYHCAVDAGCEVIITRNNKDFKASDLPALSPSEFLIFWAGTAASTEAGD